MPSSPFWLLQVWLVPEFAVHSLSVCWESLSVQTKVGDELCNLREMGRTGQEKPSQQQGWPDLVAPHQPPLPIRQTLLSFWGERPVWPHLPIQDPLLHVWSSNIQPPCMFSATSPHFCHFRISKTNLMICWLRHLSSLCSPNTLYI